jgi:hypothetical protein
VTGPGTTTLYEGNVWGLAADGERLVISSDALERVDLSGGGAVAIASPQSPSGLLVLHGIAYFNAERPVGVPDSQGKQQTEFVLESVPVSGGDPTVLPGLALGNLASATDEDSLYFDAASPATLLRLTPPSTAPSVLELEAKTLIDAIAVRGNYVYVAGQDFGNPAAMQNGLIDRIPKTGGAVERLVSNIGHPWSLVADDDFLYWVEDPPNFGAGSIVRANLDGSSRTTLVPTSARSLAVSNGRLVYAWDAIESVPSSGGTPTVIAAGATTPGMLVVMGGNVVWADPIEKARSDPTVPKVMTACLVGSGQ